MSEHSLVKTTCPYCGVGCGVEVSTVEASNNGDSSKGDDSGGGNLITVAGDKDHPANAGKLCSKGSDLAQTLSDDNRLLHPYINDQQVSWDEATTYVAKQLNDTISQYGHDSVAFYVSGQILTEDYYVVNKLTKGWLGTANVDTNSRLCMASSVVGHKRAFGTDTVPGSYKDLDSAELIVLVGSNLAWCHPVIYQRIMAEKARRPELFIVAIDPRRTATADSADLHLPIRHDADTTLFNGLLNYLAEHGACDDDFMQQHVSGCQDALHQALQWTAERVANTCGVELTLLEKFFQRFKDTEKCVSVYSQGVNQSSSGSDKVNAIINCHLATGRIGKPGMGPFSITGQPNAMGGREVGGLATMLACHMELNNPAHRQSVQQFWNSPRIADEIGLCAVELFDAVADGRIKAVWIMGTNPVDSLPEADKVKAALQACPLVIVSDIVEQNDTLDCAQVRLPAQAWGEKDGTVTNSERCISRQRGFKTPAGEARADWWAVCAVARKMGFVEAFDYAQAADIFREYAALSAYENRGSRDFDIGAAANLSDEAYTQLKPFYWPWIKGSAPASPIRFFANGGFFTPDKRARMLAIESAVVGNESLSDHYPLIMNTGRNRDQWHTMTRTGYSARLSRHLAEPYIDMNPQDALIHGIQDADVVQVRSPQGDVYMRALLSERQQPGHIFAPLHWTDQFASRARIDSLISSLTDPHSKQPASKNQVVAMQRFNATSYAYGITRMKPALRALSGIEYWALAPIEGGWQFEVASKLSTDSLHQSLIEATVAQRNNSQAEPLELNSCNKATDTRSSAVFTDEQLQKLIFLGAEPVQVSRSWAQQQLIADWSDKTRRWQLLAGRTGSAQPDKGAIVCSCFSVGMSELERAVTEHHCQSLQEIGEHLQAGTNCGSCRSEIQGVITRCARSRELAIKH